MSLVSTGIRPSQHSGLGPALLEIQAWQELSMLEPAHPAGDARADIHKHTLSLCV